MFKRLEVLTTDAHRDLRFKAEGDYSFCADVATVPVMTSEFSDACKEFPIVFISQEGRHIAVALLGLAEGVNAFVDSAGKWKGRYIPAQIRRYPFIASATGQPDEYNIAIDRDAPQWKSGEGESLFLEDGSAGPLLKSVTEFLQTFQQQAGATEKFCQALAEAECLIPRELTITLNGGGEKKLTGFAVIDTDKVLAAAERDPNTWVKEGLLGLCYAHWISLGNFGLLVPQE